MRKAVAPTISPPATVMERMNRFRLASARDRSSRPGMGAISPPLSGSRRIPFSDELNIVSASSVFSFSLGRFIAVNHLPQNVNRSRAQRELCEHLRPVAQASYERRLED